MSEVIKIGKKYTIVIPKKMREKLGLKEGQISEIDIEEEKIVITPKALNPFERLGELIGSVTYEEKTERKAEKWLLRER